VRDVAALRRRSPDLLTGKYESLAAPDQAWVWRRGAGTVVALNLSDDPVETALTTSSSQIAIGTNRSRDGAAATGTISLGPWEGVVVQVNP
jgi:hypothetical protein